MSESVMTSELQPSRRLPPAEAWKSPKDWIDLKTGKILPNIEKLELPTDDRNFVITDQAVRLVLDTLFWPDYEWPYNPFDPEIRPDNHHFYFEAADYSPEANGGLIVPRRFRETPTMIGRMPRQLHDVFHDATNKPKMPEIDAMEEYVDSYDLAHLVFKNLFDKAKEAVAAQELFPKRRKSVALGAVIPKGPDDSIGEGYMRSFFEEHFRAYSQAVNAAIQIDNQAIAYPGELNIDKGEPQLVLQKLGGVVMRRCVDMLPLIPGYQQA